MPLDQLTQKMPQAGKKLNRKLSAGNKDEIIINPKDDQDKAFVREEKESTAVMAFGRFNPPTTGHEKLIHTVHQTAKQHNGSAHVFASHSEGTSSNPLPQKHKLNYLKKVAEPHGVNIHGSSKEEPNFLHAAKKLHDAGHKHLVMVAGSDRAKDYEDKLKQYNGKEGHYNFKSIKVVSSGERDPDAEGVSGMSGTKMRAHARAGEHEHFKAGLPKALHPHANEIIGHIKSVKEDVNEPFAVFAEQLTYDKQKVESERSKRLSYLKKMNTSIHKTHKGIHDKAHEELDHDLNENIRQWFQDKWVRMDTKGNIKGQCAREEGEGKPKCLPLAKARAMDKEDRAAAAQRKRRQDPNPERSGSAINVATEEKDACYHKVKSRYKIWPSAYASGALVKCRKAGAKNWGTKTEEVDVEESRSHKILATALGNIERWKNVSFDQPQVKKPEPEKKKDEKKENKNLSFEQFNAIVEMVENATISESAETSLKFKSFKTGVPYDVLAEVYQRGIADWNKIDYTTQTAQQWAFARVNSFVSGGKAFEMDSDLHEQIQDLLLDEGKMAELHADIEQHLGKHVASYKKIGGSEHLGNKTVQVAKKLAKQHNISHEAAQKHVNDYVDNALKEEADLDEGKTPAWQRKAGKNPEGGLNRKGIASYRKENPGSKLSMAVTTKPSKLDPDSKAAKRRKSFCARMSGMKKRLTSAKTAKDPDSRINKALRKWNC
jgi:hypothetical protein